jgi:IrrE N-terminal-like domain
MVRKKVGVRDSCLAFEALVRRYREPGEPLESIAARLGVRNIVEQPLPADGALVPTGQGSYVMKINSMGSRERRRFTLAHEIGHLILQESFKAMTSCQRDPELEGACDSIAAELLMPASVINPYVLNLSDPSPSNLVQIANRFHVSLRAAAHRVHYDLRLWSQSIGLWQFEEEGSSEQSDAPSDCPRERWFVGKRLWKTERPPFKVFFAALSSDGPVRKSETYIDYEENVARHPLLEVLHLGGKRLLGVVFN